MGLRLAEVLGFASIGWTIGVSVSAACVGIFTWGPIAVLVLVSTCSEYIYMILHVIIIMLVSGAYKFRAECVNYYVFFVRYKK